MNVTWSYLKTWVRSRVKDDRAASLVEYALLVALIAMVCIAAVTLLGSTASNKFSQIASGVSGAGS